MNPLVLGNSMIYLDWAATSIPEPAILSEALASSLEAFGNP